MQIMRFITTALIGFTLFGAFGANAALADDTMMPRGNTHYDSARRRTHHHDETQSKIAKTDTSQKKSNKTDPLRSRRTSR